MAKLTSEEREILINALVENEAIEESDREVFEVLKDAKLIAFADSVLNSETDDDDDDDVDDDTVDGDEELTDNSEDESDEDDDEDFEDEEDEEEPATNAHVCNMCAGKMKGKKGKKPAPEEEDESGMTGNMTDEEWFEQAPPGVASVVANAMKLANEEKARLISEMTCNLSGSQKTATINHLANYSLDELKVLAPLTSKPAPTVNVGQIPGMTRRGTNYAGSASPPTTNSKGGQKKSEPLIMPTINWAEAAKEFAGQN